MFGVAVILVLQLPDGAILMQRICTGAALCHARQVNLTKLIVTHYLITEPVIMPTIRKYAFVHLLFLQVTHQRHQNQHLLRVMHQRHQNPRLLQVMHQRHQNPPLLQVMRQLHQNQRLIQVKHQHLSLHQNQLQHLQLLTERITKSNVQVTTGSNQEDIRLVKLFKFAQQIPNALPSILGRSLILMTSPHMELKRLRIFITIVGQLLTNLGMTIFT